jgi:hypothetical protein
MKPTSRMKAMSAIFLLGMPLAIVAAAEAPTTQSEKLSRLQGRARESRTRDVVGAMVLVQGVADPSAFYVTTSGGDGAFFVDRLPDGDYTVRLNREGYASEVKTGIQLKFPFRAVVEVTMEPGQPDLSAAGDPATGNTAIDLHGSVIAATGSGLGEISVRIVRQDGSVDPLILRTPKDGAFRFDAVPAGEWRLEIVGIGYLPVNQRLMFNSDSAVTVQLIKQPPDYVPSPLELMPPEAPIVPEGFAR